MKELNSSFAEQSCIVRNYELTVTLSKKHFSHSQQSISLTLKIIRNLGSNKVYRHDTISIRMAKFCNDSVTLLTSLFMFHLISFSPHFFIFFSFILQSISFISSTIVHLIHIYLIWLHSYYIVIQPDCPFRLIANPKILFFLSSIAEWNKLSQEVRNAKKKAFGVD